MDGCIYIDVVDDINVLKGGVRHFATAKGLILRPPLFYLHVNAEGNALEGEER